MASGLGPAISIFGGGGQVGGPCGQRGFGFAQLGLSQIGGFGDHPGLTLNAADHAVGLMIER